MTDAETASNIALDWIACGLTTDALEQSITNAITAARADERAKVVGEGWQDISTAPTDGTYIIIWFIHANAKYSKDPIGEGYAAAHVARWIDHNGGGWTWHGLAGVATYWKPLGALPAPPAGGIDLRSISGNSHIDVALANRIMDAQEQPENPPGRENE